MLAIDNSLDHTLDALDGSPYRDAIRRPSLLFERIVGTADEFVIFGCGSLGEVALRGIRNAGCKVLAFIDNNQSLHGASFRGVPVLSPAEGVRRFKDRAAFVVAIFNGSSPREQLAAIGCERIVPYPALFWRFPKAMKEEGRFLLPDRILGALDRIRSAYGVLCDDKSRYEFAAQILWRCSLDYSKLPSHDSGAEIYFPPGLVQLREDEVFMDCGAFDGDSIRLFLRQAAERYQGIVALEPDPTNRETLKTFARGNGKAVRGLSVLPYAVSDHSGIVSFQASGSPGSSLSAGAGTITVECRRIDDLIDCKLPTFIKMDIEGAELDALSGASETIRNARPILAICAYHKCEHLWRIPLLIKSILPDYQIGLRRYAEECWETVYYAVPPERRRVNR